MMDVMDRDLPEVVVVGAAAVDTVALFEEMPKQDSITFADSCTAYPGGAGANVASGLALLGRKTAFLGKLGDDDGGKLLMSAFLQSGVDTRGVRVVAGQRSSSCFIPVDSHGNRVIYALGGVALLETADEIEISLLAGVKALYIAEAFPEIALEVIRCSAPAQPKMFYSPGGVMIWAEKRLLNQVFELTDVLFVSRSEAETLCGVNDPEESIKRVADLGPKMVIETVGAEGTLLLENGRLVKIPALPLPKIVDTTGAGDAFAAGVVTGYLEGMDWEESVRLGSAVAAIKIGYLGARSGLPDRETVRKLSWK
jgi:sugar/nucleoside kinase (ribokinase family)